MTRPGRIRVAFRGTLGRFELDAAFDVPAAGVTAVFGPSGCGKTSVLRCIAGLTRVADGLCVVDGEVWQDRESFRPTHRREVGYVFQEASLFPHLSVAQNLRFGVAGGARAAQSRAGRSADAVGLSQSPATIGFDGVVDLLGLAPLLDRAPRHLSGGERQRVAIGRALLSRPRLMLMDEPLSALDRPTREEILPFLERLHETLAIPMIYVSHDMGELERLADTLVLMQAGRVSACGPLQALQSDPALPLAVARDAAVSLDALVVDIDHAYGLVVLEMDGARLLVPGVGVSVGARRRVRVAAGDVSLSRSPPQDSTILNSLPVRITAARPVGNHEMLAVLRAGPAESGATLLARITQRSWERLALAEGLDVHAQIKSVALVRESGRWGP